MDSDIVTIFKVLSGVNDARNFNLFWYSQLSRFILVVLCFYTIVCYCVFCILFYCLKCFGAVGWAAGTVG